jgi:hypothetical protein
MLIMPVRCAIVCCRGCGEKRLSHEANHRHATQVEAVAEEPGDAPLVGEANVIYTVGMSTGWVCIDPGKEYQSNRAVMDKQRLFTSPAPAAFAVCQDIRSINNHLGELL